MEPEPEGEGLEDSAAASPFGSTPSANHTLLWSRDTEPTQKTSSSEVRNTYIFQAQLGFFVEERTLVAGLLQDPDGYHDCGRRRAEHPGGLSLLQRGDGGAVLRWVVGVWALIDRSSRSLGGLN